MSFEDQLTNLNQWYFFREFTYARSTFRPDAARELELADAIIWLADILFVHQLKERGVSGPTTPEAEQNWFEKKVMKKATSQVRDTLTYLAAGPIEIKNQRGHPFNLDAKSVAEIHKLVVYAPHNLLPETCRQIKHHRSVSAGLIHVIQAADYLGIVRTLLTPREVEDYLEFRESVIDKWESEITAIPEQALVGQYLIGMLDAKPSLEFTEHLFRLEHQAEEWDVSGIISKFPDRITTKNATTDYYAIIRELAMLHRNELREFKKRFQLCVEKAKADQFTRPYRMACPSTDCGFVFITVTKDVLPLRRNGLQNFTLAHKYDQKLPKCIGVSIADDVDGWYTAEWFYADFPWQENAEMEQNLKDNFPFREVKEGILPRYHFRDIDKE
jgi:hypothetical protein